MSCYGHNLVGRRWADDEDEWDFETFKSNAAGIQHPNGNASDATVDDNGPTTATSDALFFDEDNNNYERNNSNEHGHGYEYNNNHKDSDYVEDDRDYPPRPSTPEPGFYAEPDHAIAAGEPDYADGASPSYAGHNRSYWAPLLQVPYPYQMPPGFHPNTPYWLVNGKPGKVAKPELIENGGNYTEAWHKAKAWIGAKDGQVLWLSPLRQEVKYSHEEEQLAFAEECTESERRLSLKQELSPHYPDVSPAVVKAEQSGDDMAGVSEEVSNSTGHLSLSNGAVPITFTCEDELASEMPGAEEHIFSMEVQNTINIKTPDNQDDGAELEKRDSLLEHDETVVSGLFHEEEAPVSPDSSVIVSTDEEMDVVQNSPLILATEGSTERPIATAEPIDQTDCIAKSESSSSLTATPMKTLDAFQYVTSIKGFCIEETPCSKPKNVKAQEEYDQATHIQQSSVEVSRYSKQSSAAITNSHGKWDSVMKVLSSMATTRSTTNGSDGHNDSQNGPRIEPASLNTITERTTREKEDLSCRLKARYFNIRLLGKKPCHWASSTTLKSLMKSIVL